MNQSFFIYILVAISYFVGRTGFVSSPDVFNKLRPNRYINITEIAVIELAANNTVLSSEKNTPRQLSSFASGKKNNREQQWASADGLKDFAFYSYKGIYIDPPPLLF